MENKKSHWENIYQTKQPNEVSWTQATPTTSLQFFEEYKIAKTANIIDVGGGDSFLVDNLLALGYTNISVLDISEAALNKAKIRLVSQQSKKCKLDSCRCCQFQAHTAIRFLAR